MGFSRRVATSIGSAASGIIQPPVGWHTRYPYRQYASEINGAGELMPNLAANPSIRTSTAPDWATSELHCIIQDTDSGHLTELESVIAQCAALSPPMVVYPALRVMSGVGGLPVAPSATTWCQTSYWQIVADKFSSLLSRRPAGDPRVGIDSEAYGGDELNRISLAAAGKTLDDFRAAVTPFATVLLNAVPRALPCIYAFVYGDLDKINILGEYLLNLFGPDHTELWWETAFGLPEAYRMDKWVSYQSSLALAMSERAKFETNYQALYGRQTVPFRHRLGTDDDGIQYVWGRKWKNEVAYTTGPVYPWIFDGTRSNKLHWGGPNGYNGIGLKSANDADYVFAWLPTVNTLQIGPIVSDGQAAEVLANYVRGQAATVSDGYGSDVDPNPDGILLVAPPGPFTWGALRMEGVLPTVASTPWMVDFSCKLPSSIAGDVPLISSLQYNQQSWQVYRKSSDSKLYLQIKKTSSTFDEFALSANAKAAGDAVRMQIGRSGNTWLYTEGSAAINRTDVGYSVAVTNIGLLSVGMGSIPANFPNDNQQAGCPGMLLPAVRQSLGSVDDNQLHVWKSRLPSDSEITNQIRGNHWPFGRYT